jgi:hypothetical protein
MRRLPPPTSGHLLSGTMGYDRSPPLSPPQLIRATINSVPTTHTMIFSMSSDLKTKQIVWTMRMNNGNSMPYALSAFAYAGGFAKTFKDEAKPVSID